MIDVLESFWPSITVLAIGGPPSAIVELLFTRQEGVVVAFNQARGLAVRGRFNRRYCSCYVRLVGG